MAPNIQKALEALKALTDARQQEQKAIATLKAAIEALKKIRRLGDVEEENDAEKQVTAAKIAEKAAITHRVEMGAQAKEAVGELNSTEEAELMVAQTRTLATAKNAAYAEAMAGTNTQKIEQASKEATQAEEQALKAQIKLKDMQAQKPKATAAIAPPPSGAETRRKRDAEAEQAARAAAIRAEAEAARATGQKKTPPPPPKR